MNDLKTLESSILVEKVHGFVAKEINYLSYYMAIYLIIVA